MLALLLIVLTSITGAVNPSPPGQAQLDSTWPPPPFVAEVDAALVNVRRTEPINAGNVLTSPVVGELIRGDRVLVTGCLPDCGQHGAWALFGQDGAVRLSLLRRTISEQPGQSADDFIYGRVLPRGAVVFDRPDLRSHVRLRIREGHNLAFRPDPLRSEDGWLERPTGGFVRASRIRIEVPSTFSGVHGAAALERFEGSHINRGRIAYGRTRPSSVPAEARWVHIDLSQQVLTAYEGDTLVFATLVSTGLAGKETSRGLFRVFAKAIHSAMHGPPEDSYFVDEVPHVLFFREGMALHGTFWHDHFGRRASHGCVNLSVADAEWLFDWAPPRLPTGWHTIYPEVAGRDSLLVFVEAQIPVSRRLRLIGPTPKILRVHDPIAQTLRSAHRFHITDSLEQ